MLPCIIWQQPLSAGEKLALFTDKLLIYSGFGGNATAANWEIRQGVSTGNGGTLVASGTGASVTVISRGGNEYMVKVSNLAVLLSGGKYWLNVTPVLGNEHDTSLNATTSGANAVGFPRGNNDDSFFDDYQGPIFARESLDFSMGIEGIGSPVPLPASLPLAGSGLLGLLAWGYRRRQQ